MRGRLSVGALGVLSLIASAAAQAQNKIVEAPASVKWEYHIAKKNSLPVANKLGRIGWELVAISRNDGQERWIYKRRLTSTVASHSDK